MIELIELPHKMRSENENQGSCFSFYLVHGTHQFVLSLALGAFRTVHASGKQSVIWVMSNISVEFIVGLYTVLLIHKNLCPATESKGESEQFPSPAPIEKNEMERAIHSYYGIATAH